MAAGSLGKTSASGLAYIGVAQAFRVCMTLLSTMIVSRILSPQDYGVIAMAAPITGFLLIFQDLGINQAVVQARSITPEQSNSFFWVNVGICSVTSLVLLLTSPFIAVFYHDPRAGHVVAASAFTVMLSATALQHSALMNRNMRFLALSLIDMASAASTLIVTVVAALLLHSYWALWAGSAANSAMTALLLWRTNSWKPNFQISFAGIGPMLKFGGSLSGFNLLNFLSRNLDNVIIARMRNSQEVGLYDNSYKLMMFPLQNISAPLGRVMLPVLSRLRDEPERFRRAFLLAVRALLVAAMPIIAISAATSQKLVPFLLGHKWEAAGPIFFWLSLTGILQPVANATGWLFVTSGRGKAMLHWGVFSAIVTIGGFFIGVRWGAYGVAVSLFVGTAVRLPVLYAYSTIGTSVRTADLYEIMLAPLLAGAATAALALLLEAHMPFAGMLICAIPAGYLLALSAQTLTSGGRELIRTGWSLLRDLLSGIGARFPRA